MESDNHSIVDILPDSFVLKLVEFENSPDPSVFMARILTSYPTLGAIIIKNGGTMSMVLQHVHCTKS